MQSHNSRGTKQEIQGRGNTGDSAKRFYDMCLLIFAESEKLSDLWNDLKNNTILGMEYYPNIPTATYKSLCF